MKDKSLLALVSKATRGDQSAFVEICRQKGKVILYMCRGMMGNAQDAEDAAQEVFIQLQTSIQKLKSPDAFNVWLNRLVFNTCTNLRCAMLKNDPPKPLDDVDGQLAETKVELIPQAYIEEADKRQRVAQVIESLPDKYRLSIQMFYYDEMTYAEIAEVLGTTPKAVGGYLDRARQLLKTKLEADDPSDFGSAAPTVAMGTALHSVIAQTIDSSVTEEAVNACIQAAGVGSAILGSSAGKAVAIGATGVAASGITAIILKVVLAAAVTIPGVWAAGAGARQVFTPASPPASTIEAQLPEVPQLLEDVDMVEAGNEDNGPPASGAHEHFLAGRLYLSNHNVVDKSAQNGLGGVTLELFGEAEQPVATATTAEDGTFSLSELTQGVYRLRLLLPHGAQAVASGYNLQQDETQPDAFWLMTEQNEPFNWTAGTDEPQVELQLQYNAVITGNLVLAAADAEVPPPVEVRLLDPAGKTIAVTQTDNTGQYTIVNPMIRPQSGYTLQYSLQSQRGLRLQVEELRVKPTPGADYRVTMQEVVDVNPPTLKIQLEGGNCHCGHENPTQVNILAWDASTVSIQWTITQYENGDTVAQNGVQTLDNTVANLDNGNYILTATATDAAGNTAETQQLISILR